MRYLKLSLIIFASIILAACGGGGGGGGGLSGGAGSSSVTIAIGDVSAISSGAISSQGFTTQIPADVETIQIKISSGGNIIVDETVNVAGKPGFLKTYNVPNGTILFQAFARNSQGVVTYLGSKTEQITGPMTVSIQMNKGSYSVFVSNADSSFINGQWTATVSAINPVTFDVISLDCSSFVSVYCNEPRNLAAAHNGNELFIPFRHSDNVIRADSTLPGFTSVIKHNGFNEPYAAAFTSDNSEVWVVNKYGDSISIINTSTNNVTTISPTCFDAGSLQVTSCADSPEGIAIANGKAYIANRGDGTVGIVNVSNRTGLTILSVGGEPRFAVSTPDEQFVYVSTNSSGSGIVKIRTSDDILDSAVFEKGRNLAVSPDGSKVYVGTQRGEIGIINVSNGSYSTIDVASALGLSLWQLSIYAVAIDNASGLGFATDEDRDVVYVFDSTTDTLVTSSGTPVEIQVGSTPRAIASAPGL